MLPALYDKELPSIWKDFDHFFNTPLVRSNGHSMTNLVPVDVIENDDGYKVVVDVPGVGKENMDLSFDKDRLTIRINQSEDRESEEGKYIMKQRKETHFSRTLILNGADPETINASLDSGVLTVTMNKREEAVPKRIEIL